MTSPNSEIEEILDNLYLDAWAKGREAERNQTGIRTVTPDFKQALKAISDLTTRSRMEGGIDELEGIVEFFRNNKPNKGYYPIIADRIKTLKSQLGDKEK